MQFHGVLPWDTDQHGLLQLLKAVSGSRLRSFFATLKVFGDAVSPGIISFPMPGISLALDLPVRGDETADLMDKLAAHYGGAWGTNLSRERCSAHRDTVSGFITQWQQFAAFVDPAFQLPPMGTGEADVADAPKLASMYFWSAGAGSHLWHRARVHATPCRARSPGFSWWREKCREAQCGFNGSSKTRGARIRSRAARVDLDDTSLHELSLSRRRRLPSLGFIDLAFLCTRSSWRRKAEPSEAEHQAVPNHRSFDEGRTICCHRPSPPFGVALELLLKPLGEGTLAVLSSVAGDRGRKSNYVYGATKSGLNAFLDGVRNRVDRRGVHVLTIRPGYVAASMISAA